MKIKLIFGRTAYDTETSWEDLKEVEVVVPDYLHTPEREPKYHLLGAIMPDDVSQ